MPSRDARMTYLLDQAERCAKAASTASVAELTEAYANLEQGWLQLLPKPTESENPDQERSAAVHEHPTKLKHRRGRRR